jgi:S-formylglutathione hydrolase
VLKLISENRAFDGVQRVYSHRSEACDCDMTFGLYLPAEAAFGPVPLLTYLSGLTCTHANAMEKSGAQRWAAEEGIAVLFPDTSPRGEGVPDDEAYDLGQGAGFYVNAQNAPWSSHFKMWDYITKDLHGALAELPVDLERQSITGHSMGGHGALTLAMHMPERYRAVSAFAPIANPTQTRLGYKAA